MQATSGQRLEVREARSTDRPAARRLQSVLVTMQVAVCLSCSSSPRACSHAACTGRNTIDPGLNVNGVTVVSYDLRGAGYSTAAAAAFQRQAAARLRAVPGVRRSRRAGSVPLSDQHAETRFYFPGTEYSRFIEFSQVAPRTSTCSTCRSSADARSRRAGARVRSAPSIVTESTARKLWPGEDPLAQALVLDKIERPSLASSRTRSSRGSVRPTRHMCSCRRVPTRRLRMRLLVAATPARCRRRGRARRHRRHRSAARG